ncbi:MAG: glycosyltransferase family 4 protein [Silvibacterium sp.]
MKVAFLAFHFGEYSVYLASALAEHASVLLLMPEGLADPFLANLDKRVTLRTFPAARLRQPLRQLWRNRWILRQIRSFGPDVVHLQQGSMWFNVSLKFMRRFPVVLTVHDAEPHPGDKDSRKTPYFFWKLAFRRADEIIAHNQYVKETLQSKLGIPDQLLHVIPHIQIGQATGTSTTVQDDGRTILFFGRIWPYKGLEYLIRAEPWITAQIPSAKIVIAGTGEDFNRYRQMMAHPERFIIFNRQIAEQEADQLFREASLVVLPYIESSQSGVIPVAYTYGKPVVATKVGGLPEMVADRVTGMLVPPRDEKKLAEAIVTLLADDDLRQKMGRAAKEFIERECAPAVVAQHTLAVYRRACMDRHQTAFAAAAGEALSKP